MAVKLKTKDIIRQLEHQVRLKKQQVKSQRDEVKKAAETLAESFEQKRKLKAAAKKILTHTML